MQTRKILSTGLLTAAVLFGFNSPPAAAAPAGGANGKTPRQWSVSMAESQMTRLGNKLAWTEGSTAKWDYTAGLFTLSLLKLNELANDPARLRFATNAIGTFILDDGKIRGYKQDEYQLDALNPGKTALALWQLTKEERYLKCAQQLRQQLNTQPRTSDGGFWHKQRYTNQMWLDGIYMAEPFYAEYEKLLGETNNDLGGLNAFDDIARQFSLINDHTYDAKTGLNWHGWDAAKIQSWANPATGCSSNFWGRAVGWYAMALVDTLDYFPADHPARAGLIATLQKLSKSMLKHQDPASGLWWQVLDQPNRAGNYLEATASAMFIYTLAKGVNQQYLPRDYAPDILRAYQGMIEKFVKTDAAGQIALTQCCQVAGLGFTSNSGRPRDGSFDYYVNEPVVENDLKGVGPFILAGIEVQKLQGIRTIPPPPKRHLH